MRYFLNFKSDNYGKKEISDPWGMDKVILSLKQKPNGMGRDVSFAADSKNSFEFSKEADHEFDYLLYYNRKFGFEADVDLIIEVDENNTYVCNLDFSTADTDDFSYFKCMGVEDSKLQIINARKSTKVDVFANTDIDGNPITPLVAENMLILAKPVYQTSQWNDDTESVTDFVAKYFINFARKQSQYEIENSYVPFVLGGDSESIKDNPLIEFQNNATSISLRLNLKINGYASNRGYGIKLRYFKGSKSDFNPLSGVIEIASADSETGLTYNSVINIPSANRGEFLWIYAFIPSGISSFPVTRFYSYYYDVKVTANTVNYNSVAKSLRLIDVMRQVIKSISGLNINADRFDTGTILYDQRLTNGNLLRGITDKPFRVSLEDLEKSFNEFKGDYEIGSDAKVFFGIEDDFYTNNEIMFFPQEQFSDMHKTYNQKYTVNEFHYLYKNFQSKKENEEQNSADTIHGEGKWSFFTKKVENKKVVDIEWIRDAFLIEETRGKALEISSSTSSQEDDSLFILDTKETLYDVSFIESSSLEHTKDVNSDRLILRNDGSVNFVVIGIAVGSEFVIKPVDLNSGAYTVYSVTENQLELTKTVGVVSGAGNGVRQTVYSYTIKKENIPFTNYTDEGFSETENLNADFSYSNRRFSIRQNINNYWTKYLATCNLYTKDKPLRNFWYKNNPSYTTKFNGVKVTENDDINPTNPILTPVLYEDIVFSDVDFADFITLQTAIRSIRGYIRAIDNNNNVVKIYPVDVMYSLKDRTLSIKAEEKYEPTSMTIDKLPSYIEVNGEVRANSINYRFEGQKLVLLDDSNQRLYSPVYWMEVSVNGAIPESIEKLTEWLDLLNI